MALVLVAGGTTACTGESSRPDVAPRPSTDPVACVTGDDARPAAQTLLDRRAAAVRRDDLDAFLATLDPKARDRVTDEQRAWFARIQQLPRHTFDLTLSVDRSSTEDSLTAYVNQEVKIDGIDQKPLGAVHRVTFVHRGDCWHVGSDDVEDIQVMMAPWDDPDSIIEHRDGVLLVTNEKASAERHRILDAAVEAWRAERRLLASQDRRPDDRGVVVLAFTTDQAMNANGYYYRSLELTGGITTSVMAGSDRTDYRVLVAPSSLRDDSATYLHTMLRHEFVHVLLARHPLAPQWATEGVAEYYSSGRAGGPVAPITDVVQPGSVTDGVGLPTANFYADTWEVRAGNYALAWAAMAVIGDEYGTPEPARLVKALDRARADYRPERVDRILDERYGLTADELGARARELIASVT